MHSSLFFKLFPPPKFMLMKHAGLEISDDAIRFLEYSGHPPNCKILKFQTLDLPEGVVSGGEVVDVQTLTQILIKIAKENNLSYVKVSVPEEKSYLFKTDISSVNPKAVAQNIEFKMEENVPLPLNEAIFYFDILPKTVTGNELKASVSVVPKSYVENIISILKTANLSPVAFEVAPKSIARSIISAKSEESVIVAHIMRKKTGIYIISGGVVCFTSTIGYGTGSPVSEGGESLAESLSNEIIKVASYWTSHNPEHQQLEQVVLVGNKVLDLEPGISEKVAGSGLLVSIGNVWANAFSLEKYIPPIFRDESFDYAVVAGLATDL